MKGEKIFSGLELFFMELTLQEKLKLIKFFEFLLNKEVSKPLGEMNSEAVDDYIKILLHLQDKHVELSSDFINEQVRKIFREEETAAPEAIKTTKKHFNKKKIWLVAACISILVALFSIISVANDWNVFDFLSEKFGSVHSAPFGKEQEINGISVWVYNKTKIYPSLEDALKAEKTDVLYPAALPEGLTIKGLTFTNVDSTDEIVVTFNDDTLSIEICRDVSLSESTKDFATDVEEINNFTCYICEMPDVNICQISFEHKGDTYTFNHSSKELLIEIIENLKEIKNEN